MFNWSIRENFLTWIRAVIGRKTEIKYTNESGVSLGNLNEFLWAFKMCFKHRQMCLIKREDMRKLYLEKIVIHIFLILTDQGSLMLLFKLSDI